MSFQVPLSDTHTHWTSSPLSSPRLSPRSSPSGYSPTASPLRSVYSSCQTTPERINPSQKMVNNANSLHLSPLSISNPESKEVESKLKLFGFRSKLDLQVWLISVEKALERDDVDARKKLAELIDNVNNAMPAGSLAKKLTVEDVKSLIVAKRAMIIPRTLFSE